MQYAYCSMRDVIGRVIRNTNVPDSTHVRNIHEWVYEAMEMMQTEQTLKGAWTNLTIHFYKAKLPCGLRDLDAVQYNGRRLPQGGGARSPEKFNRIPTGTEGYTVFQTSIRQLQTIENHIVYHTELTKIDQLSWNERDYYYTEQGVLNTSFSDGVVTIYYQAVPMDDDGLPLIPDNQNFKQALYWYCRAMMIGAGFADKIFSYEYCFQQFDNLYAPRAISEIRMLSPDQMERRVNTLTRFLPAAGYFDSFFHTDRPEGSFLI